MAPLDAADQVIAVITKIEELCVELRQFIAQRVEEETGADDADPRT